MTETNVKDMKVLLEDRIVALRKEVMVELEKPDYSKEKANDLITQVLALQNEYRSRYVTKSQ